MPRRPSHYLQILILCTLWFFETLHSFRFYFLLHSSWESIKFMFWRITSNLWYFFLPISILMLESGGKGVAPRGNLNFFWNYHSKGTEIRPGPPPPPVCKHNYHPHLPPPGEIFWIRAWLLHTLLLHFLNVYHLPLLSANACTYRYPLHYTSNFHHTIFSFFLVHLNCRLKW